MRWHAFFCLAEAGLACLAQPAAGFLHGRRFERGTYAYCFAYGVIPVCFFRAGRSARAAGPTRPGIAGAEFRRECRWQGDAELAEKARLGAEPCRLAARQAERRLHPEPV